MPHPVEPREMDTRRSCNGCTLCCRLPEIEAFSKPANAWCLHCSATAGCAIYAERPQLCRDFLCLWMADIRLGPEWEPALSHMMIYSQGQQMTVLVDPLHPGMWLEEPYHGQLRQWARDHEEAGGYIIVFVGDAVFKVDPAAARASGPCHPGEG